MHYSQCPKCNQADFRLESIIPAGSDSTIVTVICSACYSIVGTLDPKIDNNKQDNIELQFQQLNKKLENIHLGMEKLANGMQLIYKKINNS